MESIYSTAPSFSILIVEDEDVSRELTAIILSKKFPDAVLHTAVTGRAGLELFETFTPDIVITDINMPHMCGADMVEKIRAIKPYTKCIAVTGKSVKTDVQNSIDKGVVFDRCIAKPVIFNELFTAIEECLREIT